MPRIYVLKNNKAHFLSDGSVPSPSPPNSQPQQKSLDEIIEQQPHGVQGPQ